MCKKKLRSEQNGFQIPNTDSNNMLKGKVVYSSLHGSIELVITIVLSTVATLENRPTFFIINFIKHRIM